MTITYFLMLFFVYWCAWLVYGYLLPSFYKPDSWLLPLYRFLRMVFSVLAAFFFHSVW